MRRTFMLLSVTFFTAILGIPISTFAQTPTEAQATISPAAKATEQLNGQLNQSVYKLPNEGILALRRSLVAGGVVVSEARGMALVLSSDPLVLVTGADWLGSADKEKQSQIPGTYEQIEAQSYMTMGGGMMGGMGGGIRGPGMTTFWQPLSSVVKQIRGDEGGNEASDGALVFIFVENAVSNSYSTAKLAMSASPDKNWMYFGWESLEADQPTAFENIETDLAVAVSPPHGAALICKEQFYGRSQIMRQYLSAYRKLAVQQSNDPYSNNPFSDDPFAKHSDPFGQPFGHENNAVSADPFGNQAPPSADPFGGLSPGGQTASPQFSAPLANWNQTTSKPTASQHEQAIIDAVIAIKMSKDIALRNAAIKQLRDMLAIEFDAQRALKSADLAALQKRLEELTQAERDRAARRDALIEERLQSLLGNQ